MPFSNVFKLIGKAFRSATKRPIQRFNIYKRSEKYIGEESKYFFPAPRAVGPVSKLGPSQYPHLEGGGVFKSVKQRRVEAIEARNRKLLETGSRSSDNIKSFSEIKQDDSLVIEGSQRLPVIKTTKTIDNATKRTAIEGPREVTNSNSNINNNKLARPLPTSTNLDMHNLSSIWAVDKVPPGRLDLNKLQELMINKLADDNYWTPKQIAETYNIKEQYAENLINYLKQIRVVVSPRMAKILDYTNRTNEAYNATKHIVYIVDKSMRTKLDKSVDETFLPEDELDDSIRELLDAGQVEKRPQSVEEMKELFNLKRPEPLKIMPANFSSSKLTQASTSQIKGLQPPSSSPQPSLHTPPLPNLEKKERVERKTKQQLNSKSNHHEH